MSAMPSGFMFLFFFSAFAFDNFKRRFSLLLLRKAFNAVGFLAPVACFLSVVAMRDNGFW